MVLNLLTGSTGFVGGHVVEYLFQQGEISRGTFRKGSRLKILDLNGVQGVETDLLDRDSLLDAVQGADAIYSMASPMPGFDADFDRFNTEGPKKLVEVAKKAGVKTIVYLSTLDVHGFGAGTVDAKTPLNPMNSYQRSKASAERVFLDFAAREKIPRVVVVRAARAVGSRDESLTIPLLRSIESRKVVLPMGSEMSFTHPRDIAQAMYKAATGTSVSGGVYLVKSFDATLENLARCLAQALRVSVNVKRGGILSRTCLPQYADEQLRASLRIGPQASWGLIRYSPAYNLEKTCEEIAFWYRKEPWVAEPA
jgi:dihydroflavonol-4-reductase